MQNIYNNCFELLTIVNCYFKVISLSENNTFSIFAVTTASIPYH